MKGIKPEVSIGVALPVAALVYAIFANATPPITDVRQAQPGDADVDAARKLAVWTAAGVVGAVSLIAGDPNVFILGGGTIVVMDWWHRHANEVDPLTGRAASVIQMDSGMMDDLDAAEAV